MSTETVPGVLKLRKPARLATWGVVPLVLLSQGLINVGLGTFGVLFNLYLASIGKSLAFIGAFNAISILALGVSAMLIGAGARMLSHRQAMAVGTLLLVGVQAVLALTTTSTVLLAAGAIFGLAQALCVVPIGPLLADSVDRRQRAAVFGRLYAIWGLATGIGSILGGVLPGLIAVLLVIGPASGTAAYRGALLVSTVITLLAWPPLLRLPPGSALPPAEPLVDAPPGRGWALRTVPRTLVAVVSTIGLFSFAAGIVAPFFNVYFAQQLHLATALIGILFALAAFLSVPASLLGTRLSRRLGSVHAVVLVRLAMFPCLVGLALGTILPLLAISGFLVRFALIYLSGALDNHFTLSAVPPRSRPLAAGLRAGSYNVFWALGAGGAGQLIDRVGYPALFLASAVLSVAASLLFLGLFGWSWSRRS